MLFNNTKLISRPITILIYYPITNTLIINNCNNNSKNLNLNKLIYLILLHITI